MLWLLLFLVPLSLAQQQQQWIVTLKPQHRLVLSDLDHRQQIQLDHAFVVLDSPPPVEWLAHEDVVAIEPVTKVHKSTIQPGSAYWHLDRLDGGEFAIPKLDGRYSYTQLGTGVTAFVLDSGVRLTHEQFGGRATFGFDALGESFTGDCDGHGTHVAGLVASTTYGAAKSAQIKSVRVLDCQGSGSNLNVISGLAYVRASGITPAVAVMSLGGEPSTALDTAVSDTVAAGIPVIVAAGNEGDNACNYSPARVPSALTVGASDPGDFRPSFSNFGSCVDLYAPGVYVLSLSNTSDTAVTVLSGTSMATPLVAGLAALVLEENPGYTPAQIVAALKAKAAAVNSGPLAHTLYADIAELNATAAREVLIPSEGVEDVLVRAWTVIVLLLLPLIINF
jgi:subtilisin family serine protease